MIALEVQGFGLGCLDGKSMPFDNLEMRFLFDRNLSIRSRFARISALLMVFTLAMTTFSDDADARRKKRRRARKVKRIVINEPKLFERIGGPKTITLVVDDWVRSSLGDERLSGSFGDTTADPGKVAKIRKTLNDQVCGLADGTGCAKPDAKVAKEIFSLPEEKFVIFSDHLFKSLDRTGVREREKNELLAAYGEARDKTVPAEADADTEGESDSEAE